MTRPMDNPGSADAIGRGCTCDFIQNHFGRGKSDHDGVAFHVNFALQTAQRGIVLEQVRQRLGVGQVIRRYEFNIRIVQACPDDVSSNAAEAVDADFYGHNPLR